MKHKPGHHHKKDILDMVEIQLGKNFDADIIQEVANHMEECPDCKIYVDSVQQTIKLYRSAESDQEIPEDVSDRLFKVLDLK